MLEFGRDICSDLAAAERREWLVTNGIGGYAMGTVSGLLTRSYHGLLVAALNPPLGRTLVLAKLDETAVYDGSRVYHLFANRWADGTTEPNGFIHLEGFRLEGTTPVWCFAMDDAILEKRIWMQHGANTTYVQYRLKRASAPLSISAKMLVNYRDHHGQSEPGALPMEVDRLETGLRVLAFPGARILQLSSNEATFTVEKSWVSGFRLAVEEYRGLRHLDANYWVGSCQFTLAPGQAATLVCSIEESPESDGEIALAARRERERRLLQQAASSLAMPSPERMPNEIRHLMLAADQFIVKRATAEDENGRTVIAGYPWFGDWGRDTMIALPGLTLVTGRTEDAAKILRTFAQFTSQGMLPNRFPDVGEEPEYNTVDATLWYFETVRDYLDTTGDAALVADLFPVLQEIVSWHERGTRFGITVDPSDGLLFAGQEGVQLTWMDAKVDDFVVTPRIGKPVEVNALWFNALRAMVDFSRRLGEDLPGSAEAETRYEAMAKQAQAGFARFWNGEAGYCYDVLDGPNGDDDALRPNQLMAVALPYSPLEAGQQRQVVDAVARHLLTSHGLRSLAADHRDYQGRYGGDRRQRDAAYHQGTVWSWLMGPFVSAHLRVYGDPALTSSFLSPLLQHLSDHGVGNVSEIFDGDPPFTARGCPAQAWSVAELLRVWRQLQRYES